MYNKLLISNLFVMSLLIGAWAAYTIQVILRPGLHWLAAVGLVCAGISYLAGSWL